MLLLQTIPSIREHQNILYVSICHFVHRWYQCTAFEIIDGAQIILKSQNEATTWTLTLREEKRLQVFESKVLRKIYGSKRDDETGEWRRLHNGELHELYGKPDVMRIVKSRRLQWAGHVTRMGNEKGAWKLLVGKPVGKRPVGRPRMRWENNINHDLREVDYTGDD